MAIPPFPPQDLAKLVLGYLAEEELMTAYDEFLQASPYLDAFGNEYDRIFMTSLRSILADYRAVKIHVETCKPHALRKKLLQCSNLLEIVKFLITIIDAQKLNFQDNTEKIRLQKLHGPRGTTCEVCYSLNQKNCVCKNNVSSSIIIQTTNDQPAIINNLLEATPLDDLPGNVSSKSKPKLDAGQRDKDQSQDILSSTVQANNYNAGLPIKNNVLPASNVSQITKPSCMDSKQKIEEFNNILNLVCNKSVTNDKLCDNIASNPITNKTSCDGSFQDFASGVYSNNQEKLKHVPDSSTSEMYMPLPPKSAKETLITNIKGPPNHIFTQPGILLNSPSSLSERPECKDGTQMHTKEANKIVDNKIRILSDVKFDNKGNTPVMPSLLKSNSTSTPCSLPKHTLIINGTPANRKKPAAMCGYNYSKDEIMAMPTLIIVPTSGPCNIVSTTANSTTSILNIPSREPSNTSSKRDPIYIDVPVDDALPSQNNKNNVDQTKTADLGLIKTIDSVTHASLPKDNTVMSKTSTPQILPPLRKSSSTPRRTSHVRVLDFTTPRRILDEAIPEKESTNDDGVVVVSDSPVHAASKKDNIPEKQNLRKNINTELNKVGKIEKKRNWDEELRALVSNNEDLFPATQPKASRISKTKNNHSNRSSNVDDSKRESTKVKKSKKKIKSAEHEEPNPSDLKKDKPVKPTINIISAQENVCPSVVDTDKKQNKSNELDDPTDTPETDRLSLQNVIGAKLNISDFLETPYKQAIYDIQMETPRFLGPDLPGEPISDIKIMNIPTPRFFDTPKPVQATPSSYSSRPTDYSSGGSYYKPDDQDYIPSNEVASCTITDTKTKDNKGKIKSAKSKDTSSKETRKESSTDVKSSKTRRPVRKCAKNVSYYNTSNTNNLVKENDVSDDETAETTNINSSKEKNTKSLKNKSIKPKTMKSKTKPEKHKSPFKKEAPKNFMKIKPRRLTPVKDSMGKNRRNTTDVFMSARKKSIKDKSNNSATQSSTVVPKKSRRKSSTPRKLHCNKTFHSSTSSSTASPDGAEEKKVERKDVKICVTHDSDSEQQPLRWSDDGSQDAKVKDTKETSVKDDEETIVQIQEYIETMETKQITTTKAEKPAPGSLQNDLIKRGFDLVTAKIIERDLLDTPPIQDGVVQSTSNDNTEDVRNIIRVLNEGEKIQSNVVDESQKANKNVDEENDAAESDDIDFTVVETNEDSNNYFAYAFDEATHKPVKDITKLKDKFSMEVCIDDGVSVRLRATQLSVLLDQEPLEVKEYDKKEIESAVSSISTMDRLYTPIKDPRMQCYELFDSTLTSLDTPLKPNSPKEREIESSVTEIVLEVENISSKAEGKKRRRVQSGMSDEGSNANKRTKTDNQYLLNPANIQNIDIESVLSKLHGP